MSIAKNTAFMTVAFIGQKIISLVYFLIIAAKISDGDLGKYYLALTTSTMFVVFVDLGFTNVFIRESARSKEEMQKYISNVLSAKLILGLLSYLAMVFTVHLMKFESDLRFMVYLSGITMLFDSLHLIIYGALRALDDLKYEAFGMVASQLFTLILGLIFLKFNLPLFFLIIAFTVPSFLNVCYSSYFLNKKHSVRLFPSVDKVFLWKIIKITLPFSIAAILGRIYNSADVFILKKIIGNEAVGWYAPASKMTVAFQFLPVALVAAAYPRFSEYYAKDKKSLTDLFLKSFKYLLLIATPIAAGIFVLADSIIMTLLNKYSASIMPLRILILSLIFLFLSFPIGALLNACDQQKKQTARVGAVLIINIILNIIFISKFGVIGVSLVSLLSSFLVCFFGMFFVSRVIKINYFDLFWDIFRILTAGAIMAFIVWITKINLNFYFSVLAGLISYPGLILLFKVVDFDNFKHTAKDFIGK